MEEKKTNQQSRIEVTSSNIIFGTSSDDIQQGLHNQQFIDPSDISNIDDKDLIVNEEVQNEIVNPSEETFNEELAPSSLTSDVKSESEEQDTDTLETDELSGNDLDNENGNQERKISKDGD